MPRHAWLEIDTDALAGNLATVRSLVGPHAAVAAVVKSDGYGHGIEVAARTLRAAGADILCVATLDEAALLRARGVSGRLMMLFPVPARELRTAAELDLELVVADSATPAELVAACGEQARGRIGALKVHLEIETGLERAGVPPERALDAARLIADERGLELVGMFSHLASPHDAETTHAQRGRLEAAVASLESAGVAVPPRHLAATGGLFAGNAPAYEMVRAGLALYGEIPHTLAVAETAARAARSLRPAMTLKARALRIERIDAGVGVGYGATWRSERESVIATLPLGYGDGWARAYGGRADALVRGRRVPLVGTVAMDALAADVTDVPGVNLDDEFVLLGAQHGERITASELARSRTTISWEVLASMSARLPRVYHAAAGLSGLRTLLGETLAEVLQ